MPSSPYSNMSGGSNTQDESSWQQNFDAAGQDIIQQRGDELSKLRSSSKQAMYGGDIGSGLAQQQRIRDLQGYIGRYAAGNYGTYGGPFGEVVSPMRQSGMTVGGSTRSTSSSGTEHGMRPDRD